MYSVVLIEERSRKIVRILATGFNTWKEAFNYENDYCSSYENNKEAYANGWVTVIRKGAI